MLKSPVFFIAYTLKANEELFYNGVYMFLI